MNMRSHVWTVVLFAVALAGGALLIMGTVAFLAGGNADVVVALCLSGVALMAAAIAAADQLRQRCVDTG